MQSQSGDITDQVDRTSSDDAPVDSYLPYRKELAQDAERDHILEQSVQREMPPVTGAESEDILVYVWCLTKPKSISQVQVDKAETAVDQSGFFDVVSRELETQEPNWTVDIPMGMQKVQFKLDTGAEVMAMSDLSYKTLQGVCTSRASRLLFGPDHTHLDVLGQFSQTLAYGEKKSKQQVFVIKGLKNNLLGLPTIEALELAARLELTDSYQARIVAEYPSAFHGLGVPGEPYTIDVDPEAKPYAIFTPRRVPYPIRDKVQKELSRMES